MRFIGLSAALCRIRQGKKVINWETHSLTVDNNQIILFPVDMNFILRITQKQVFYLAEMLYYPIDLIEKFQNLYAITVKFARQDSLNPQPSISISFQRKFRNT